jgi:hypothetical protein
MKYCIYHWNSRSILSTEREPTYVTGLQFDTTYYYAYVEPGSGFYLEGTKSDSVRTRAKCVPAVYGQIRRTSRNRKDFEEFLYSSEELAT